MKGQSLCSVKHGGHLEHLFCASPPEQKEQFPQNMVDSKSKIVKIVPIGNGSHLDNLFCTSSPETKGQLTRNLARSIGETCR